MMIRNLGNPMQGARCMTEAVEKSLAVDPYYCFLKFPELGL